MESAVAAASILADTTVVKPPEIRQRIEELIAPWRASDEKPPFTPLQVLVTALLLHGVEAPADDIHIWALETFRFYRKHAALLLGSYYHIHNSIKTLFCRFELPLRKEKRGDVKYYSVSPVTGELLLASILPFTTEKEPTKFDFFGLPAELREKIYEMVFGYPKSGLGTLHCYGHFETLSKSGNEQFSWDAWYKKWGASGKDRMETMRVRDILNPLLLNKQFYAEAMPTFYRINHFHCMSSSELERFLTCVAPERLEHVTHISFRYFGEEKASSKAFSMLAKMKRLRRLDIKVIPDEASWLPFRGKKMYESVMGMWGVSTLRTIRGLEIVNFDGSPTFERVLRPEMMQPKIEQKKENGRKRKIESAEEVLGGVWTSKKAKGRPKWNDDGFI
ncbi:uncharacterized protein LTR77_004510 [Saxophila tyrrhenica]|uniref:DUF7730 domain-containing protein n=1 Tax=Saxophila tyrrhenica TaxID=1690608 RepID=A0AAV9PDT0_9PEZI|nr:hypothetical protein LTR77_004510 [Saxophila tyrrhenica]